MVKASNMSDHCESLARSGWGHF